jgi:diaminopimelate decarboxylase
MPLIDPPYSIQNIPAEALVRQFGTPLYIYDTGIILRQINILKAAFSTVRMKIKFAAKALTNVSILRFMQQQGIGIDAVSIQEAELALQAGFDPAAITFTSNSVHFSEIQRAVQMGIGINTDNLPVLEKIGQCYGDTLPVCIRLKPNIKAGGNTKIQVGHHRSKYGIPFEQLPEVHALIQKYRLRINGIHIHTGSDILEAETFMQGAEFLFEAARQFKDLDFIDFGGGFKVPYREDDKRTDMAALGEKLTVAFQNFCAEYGKPLEMWFEPGKYLVSECGTLLAETNIVKQNSGINFALVNSGLNHLIRPMLYDAYHEIVNISNPAGELKKYEVVGYICETDTFGSDRWLNEVREGDILAIKNAGAYGFMMSSQYNSRFRPAEVMVHNGKAHLIRERETMDDILRNQILVEL